MICKLSPLLDHIGNANMGHIETGDKVEKRDGGDDQVDADRVATNNVQIAGKEKTYFFLSYWLRFIICHSRMSVCFSYRFIRYSLCY